MPTRERNSFLWVSRWGRCRNGIMTDTCTGICWTTFPHQGVSLWIRDLNSLYRNEGVLYSTDYDPKGFEWIDFGDAEKSIIAFLRSDGKSLILAACNFTPEPRYEYRIGVPYSGYWSEILNSDSHIYGGTGHGNFGGIEAEKIQHHGRPFSLMVTLPPLCCIIFKLSEV